MNNKTKQKDLVNRCLSNDRVAQKELVDAYGPAMYANIIRYIGKTDEAQDILQEVFIAVFRALPSFKHNSTLGHWIKTITMNKVFRSAKSRWNKYTDVMESVNHYEVVEDIGALEKLQEEDILNAIESLPEINKVVFMMHTVEGYNHQEIGEMLGVSEEGSRSRLFKARKLLKDIFSNEKIKSS